jgi:hypothetical protein
MEPSMKRFDVAPTRSIRVRSTLWDHGVNFQRVRILAPQLLLAFAVAAAGGCSLPVARYEASYDNVKTLAGASADGVAVDGFTASGSGATLSMRGVDRAASPVGDGFGDYLRDALEQEFRRAKLLDADAPTRISGDVVENRFRTWKGETIVSVEFVVRRDGADRYRRTIRSDLAWNSAFSGTVAQTNALQSYPTAIRELLRELYSDSAFLQALGATKSNR